jgi:electron transport protein HydN
VKTETFSPFVQSDAEKCIGCRTCEIACATAHVGSKVQTAGATEGIFMPRLFVMVAPEYAAPVQCHHCEDAPCRGVCQMSAISRVDGRTVVDPSRCVGCKLCLMACPFGAIEFIPLPAGTRPIFPGTSEKPEEWKAKRYYRANNCDLCVHRPEGPSCVATCPQKALELVNPVKERSRRNEEAALDLLLQGEGNIGSF